MTSETANAIRLREQRAGRRRERRQVCQSCANPFTPTRTDQAFCCPACRQLAYRRRRLGGIDAARRPTDGPWLAPEPGPKPEAAPGASLAVWRGGRRIEILSLIA